MADTAVTEYGKRPDGTRMREFTVRRVKVSVHAQDGDAELIAEELTESLVSHAVGVAHRWRALEESTEAALVRARNAESRAILAEAALPPKQPARLMAPGCVRFDSTGVLWLLADQAKGWSAFGVCCDGWDDLFRRYNVRVTGAGIGETGPWWSVENAKDFRR